MTLARSGTSNSAKAAPAPRARSSSRVAQSQEELYSLVIGEANLPRYLRKFAQFDRDGKTSAGWHWAAFFATFWWLLYRKSWLNAALYLFLPGVLLGLATAIASPFGPAAVGVATLAIGLPLLLLPPLYADAAYYRLCRKRISKVLRLAGKDPETLRALLVGQGGTSRAAPILAMLLAIPLAAGMLAVVSVAAEPDDRARGSVLLPYADGEVDRVQAAARRTLRT